MEERAFSASFDRSAVCGCRVCLRVLKKGEKRVLRGQKPVPLPTVAGAWSEFFAAPISAFDLRGSAPGKRLDLCVGSFPSCSTVSTEFTRSASRPRSPVHTPRHIECGADANCENDPVPEGQSEPGEATPDLLFNVVARRLRSRPRPMSQSGCRSMDPHAGVGIPVSGCPVSRLAVNGRACAQIPA